MTRSSLLRRLLLAALVFAGASGAAAGQYQLVWQDEFEGTSLDPTKWEPQIGDGCPSLCGWGNGELQYYRAENATVSGGFLTITAREESFGGRDYTSARIRTKDLGDWTYGRFEARAKLPIGRGLWAAFWMLPTDDVYGPWAASGEIDVMEAIGQEPNRVHGTIHYGGTSPGNVSSGASYTLPTGTFHDDFHVFAVEWDEFEMRWYVDGNLYATQTSWWSAGGPYPAPFDQRFHLLLNLAVGGTWPGPPNASTSFPQEFVIDYVRVYQRPEPGIVDCGLTFDDMEHAAPFANGYFVFDGPGAGGGIGANFADLPPTGWGLASLQAGWGNGGAPGFLGGFGRTFPVDLTGATHFEMWIRPDPAQNWILELNLQDDDDGDDTIPGIPDGNDDEFQLSLTVGPPGSDIVSGGGWQHVVVPLSDFVDDNSYHFGGNGVLDPFPVSSGGNGRLINVVMALVSQNGTDISFRTDDWRFTRRVGSLAGTVWIDLNGDGLNFGEPGWDGATVELLDPSLGTVLASTTSSGGGAYDFPDLGPGTYRVRVDPATLPAGVSETIDPDGLSTPHEFTVDLACEEVRGFLDFGYAPAAPTTYCQGLPNSAGPGASIAASGTVSLGQNDFTLSVTGAIPGGFGLFYFGPNAIDVPFGEGRRCVGGAVLRLAPPIVADPNGTATRWVDFTTPPGDTIAPGATRRFQYWYRDPPGGPAGFNLSDALSATFVP